MKRAIVVLFRSILVSSCLITCAPRGADAQAINPVTITPRNAPPGSATAYNYVIVARTKQKITIVSSERTIGDGPASLSDAAYNDVSWTWTAGRNISNEDVLGIDVYRTKGGSTQGRIGSFERGATSIKDNGLAADPKSKVPAASTLPPKVTPAPAGGMTAYGYFVVARTIQGTVMTGPKGSTTAGPAALDATHVIDIEWEKIPDADAYDIYRTEGGTTQGRIAIIKETGAAVYAVRDSGNAGVGSLPGQGSADDAAAPGVPSLNVPLFEGMRTIRGAKGAGPKPASIVAFITLQADPPIGSGAPIDTAQPIAVTKEVADDGSFVINVSQPLLAGQFVTVCPRGADGEDVKAGCHASLPVETPDDWGRVRAYFAGGVVFSKGASNFSQQDLALSFTLDKVWWMRTTKTADALGPQAFNTFFDVRLTAVPVGATRPGNVDQFITSEKAAIVQGGAYLPMFKGTWIWARDGQPNVLFFAPIAKFGIITAESPLGGTTSNPSGVYKFWTFGFGVGHESLTSSTDSAPSVISYMHVTFGKFENFDPTKWRAALEGRLKIPMTPFQIGIDANVPFKLTDPADLRFIFGARFDIGVLLAKLKLLGV